MSFSPPPKFLNLGDGKIFFRPPKIWTRFTPLECRDVIPSGFTQSINSRLIRCVCVCRRCCGFRELYRQDRVRIHIQFFLSLILLSVVSIAWYLLVHYELLSNPIATESVVYRNPVNVLSQLMLAVTETETVANVLRVCTLYSRT